MKQNYKNKMIAAACVLASLSMMLASAPLSSAAAAATTAKPETAAPTTSAQLSLWTNWVAKNTLPVRSPDAKDDSDLNFLKPLLKDKRFVFLGESAHGVGDYERMKARLVDYLHRHLGFNVIAFESGLGDCEAAYADVKSENATTMSAHSTYWFWHEKQALPLFQTVKDSATSKDPLLLTGMDPQQAADYFGTFMKKWFSSVSAKEGSNVRQVETAFMNAYPPGEYEPASAYKQRLRSFLSKYQHVLKFMDANKSKLESNISNGTHIFTVMRHVIQNQIETIQGVQSFTDNINLNPQYVLQYQKEGLRDRQMAENLNWMATTLYPNQKIIVWAHNGHLQKDNSAVVMSDKSQFPLTWKTVGQLLPKSITSKAYILGMYDYQGTINYMNQYTGENKVESFRYSQPSDGLEAIFAHAQSSISFLDLSHLKRSAQTEWLFTKRPAVISALTARNDVQLVPHDQYDGIMFFKTVHAPDYIHR